MTAPTGVSENGSRPGLAAARREEPAAGRTVVPLTAGYFPRASVGSGGGARLARLGPPAANRSVWRPAAIATRYYPVGLRGWGA